MRTREVSVRVNASTQSLEVLEGDHVARRYAISTAANGLGEKKDTNQTPRGRHEVRELIGSDAPVGAVFVGRERTGEAWTPELHEQTPTRDWMLTRIIRLGGLEEGRNCGGDVDTFERCIYIHGVADGTPMGVPLSHGCIRMANQDVIELFDRVQVGTVVVIQEWPASWRRHGSRLNV